MTSYSPATLRGWVQDPIYIYNIIYIHLYHISHLVFINQRYDLLDSNMDTQAERWRTFRNKKLAGKQTTLVIFGWIKIILSSWWSFFICFKVMLALPSRKLTYPPKMAYLKMIFLFPRWDMLISWRVVVWIFSQAIFTIQPCEDGFLQISATLRPENPPRHGKDSTKAAGPQWTEGWVFPKIMVPQNGVVYKGRPY